MAEQHPGARLQHPHHPGGGGAAGSAVVDDFSSSLVEAASLMEAGELAGGAGGTNKWSKNGYGNPVRRQSGKFSRSETEVVRKAVEQFCHAKQIPTSRLCSECDHKAELKGAWMEIAKALPHRSVQSVYRHGIRQLHPFKRGAWSEEECMLLADLVHKLGKKWSSIQNKINRSADSCRDKYREMSDEFTKGRWKEHDTEMLKRVIREQLNVPPNTDMRDLGRMVDEQGIQIPWSIVSKRMASRSRLSCFKKWQKMSGGGGAAAAASSPDDAHHHQQQHSPKRERDDSGAAAAAALVGGGAMARKRAKPHEGKIEYPQAATAGAAAALAHQQHHQHQHHHHHNHHHNQHPIHHHHHAAEEFYEVKLAEETVEAIDLPDTGHLK